MEETNRDPQPRHRSANPEDVNNWELAVQQPPGKAHKALDPILNLSSRHLTTLEREVLTLGLKFAPMPKKIPDPLEFYERYHEQCQWQYNKLIARPSNHPLPELIEEHLGQIKSRLEEIKELRDPSKIKQYYHNLSQDHQKALIALRKDRSLTIKPADKGTCIVIQDTTEYLREGLRELEDKETYVEIQEDQTQETAREANTLITDCQMKRRLLSVFEKVKYTTDLSEVRPQRLYWLRKVHKTPHQLRPIVSCCSGPTQKLSQLCNNLLKVHLDSVQSLVKSSTEVINIVEHLRVEPEKRKDLILATLDVKALYPSIPHGAGITMALQQALPTSPPTSSENGRKNMLREMLKLILEGNTFKFAGRTYKQIKGIAMGTPVAPTWANLFMGKLETDALTAWPGPMPLIWLRYIDDILTLFPGTQTEFDTLLVHLNSRMKSIKFTSETSKCKIDFLDVTIFKGERFQTEGVLDIRPYSKAIDPHTYLHYSSAHPRNNTRGVVRAEIVRTLRRSSSPQIFAQGVSQVLAWFSNRGYPDKLLKEVLVEVKYEDREERLKPSSLRMLPAGTTVLSVRHHPEITTGALYEALRDEELPFEPIVSRKRPPTTGDLLVRAKTPSEETAHNYHLRHRPPKK